MLNLRTYLTSEIQFVLYGETDFFTTQLEFELRFSNHPREEPYETFRGTLY